ncbi:g6558 [Coccomyxa elongata]
MKSLYTKWTKSRNKGEKRYGGTPASSVDGNRGGSTSSREASGDAKRTVEPSVQPRSSRSFVDVRPKEMSDDSAYSQSGTPAGGNTAKQPYWAMREGTSSCSISQVSSSIEGKPSMDSVLRPKFNHASESKTADSTTSLAQMVQDRLMCSESNREGEEWRDRLQPLGVGPSSARPSIDQRRLSNESARSGGAESGSTRSRRSSFALERASFDANRSSLEAFGLSNGRRTSVELAQGLPKQDPAQAVAALCDRAGVPDALRERYTRLGVVPPDTPLPMNMLKRLWCLENESDAEATANLFESKGIMRVACLFDGTAWGLVMPDHLYALGTANVMANEKVHAALLDAYLEKHPSFAAIPDDGYIMQNVGHHLVGAGRLDDLKQLLASPGWLERKLHSYGTASAVADFRRFLMVSGDEEVKLLLEAFQMSVSACLSQPSTPVLRAQMLGRLMSVRQSSLLKEWLAREEGGAEEAGRHAAAASPCLFTRTPSLEQAGGLQRMTLRGHTGGISKVLLTPGGIDVITVSADNTARVWDMEIGDCVLLLGGHMGPITNVAAAADGSMLITTSSDGSARLWELEKGECLAVLLGHSAAVNAAAIDVEGRLAVTASADGTGRVWDLASGRCIHVLSGHERSSSGVWAVALTPDARRAVTAGEDFTARVWDVLTGRSTAVLQGHSGWVVDVVITPDGTHAVTASHDGTARVWDLAHGTCERVLAGHSGRLNAVRLGPCGTTALTVSDDYTARVWDLPSGRCMHVLKGHGGWLTDGVISMSGAQAVTSSGDELAVVWDMHQGNCLNVLEGHSGEVRSVVLTRRGRFAVTGSADGTARVWDLHASAGMVQRAHSGRVTGLAVHGSSAVSYGSDGAIVWNASKGGCEAFLQGHSAGMRWVSIADQGTRLVTASADSEIKKWNLDTATCLETLPGHQGSRVKSFAVSANGRAAVSVLFDSSISVWDLEKMQVKWVLQKRGERDASRVHSGGVNAALVSDDGKLAVTLSKDCTARVWDLRSGTCMHVLVGHSDGLETASLSSDGRTLLTAAYDKSARVWDLRSGKCVAVLAPGAQVLRCAVSPQGDKAVTATEDHRVQTWDLPSGRQLHDLAGHTDDITGVAFSPDSTLLATCSRDCSLRVWQVSSGTVDGLFMADTGLTCCSFAGAQQPNTVVAGSESGIVHFLELPA